MFVYYKIISIKWFKKKIVLRVEHEQSDKTKNSFRNIPKMRSDIFWVLIK